MKKILLFAAAALMLFACSKDDQVTLKSRKADRTNKVFHAVTEGSYAPGTKVCVDDDYLLLWNDGDLFSLFDKININEQYIALVADDEGSGGNSANLILNEDVDPKELVPEATFDYSYAIFPYSEDITVSVASAENVSFGVNLPAVQTYKEKSFGQDANTMIAVANTNFLSFKNVCGYLKFKLYGKNNNIKVKSLILEGNSGEKIAGSAIITPVFEDTPSVSMQNDATNTITIDCPEGVTLGDSNNPTEFIFVIPPVTFSSGLKLKVIGTNGGVFETVSSHSLTIQRNVLTPIKKAMEVDFTFENKYKLVKDTLAIENGDYVLAYHDGTAFKLFSFTKTMANAQTAASLVAGDHGLSALLAKGTLIYSTILKENYVTVDGAAGENYINVPDAVEPDAKLSVTGTNVEAKLTLTSGDYSLRLDKVITDINEDNYFATLAVQPNAPDAINIMYALRGGKVVITFDEMIDFAVAEAKKEGVTFEDEQVNRLRSGFEHLCRLAKEILANHNMTIDDITLNTNIFDVIAQYYDNVADYSLQISKEKKFGWATPIGFYKGDDGFTANISLPQAGWFDRIQASLHSGSGTKADFVTYWAQFDGQYNILDIENFFQRLANRFANEIDQSTFELLQEVDFSAIGRVYAKYAERFNDQLEPVYLYKKVE